MSHFKGKKVIVTGASSGIGEATAKEFLKQGAKVILVSRSEEKMRDSFKDFSNESYAIYPFDLSKLEAIESFVNELIAYIGNALPEYLMKQSDKQSPTQSLKSFATSSFSGLVE